MTDDQLNYTSMSQTVMAVMQLPQFKPIWSGNTKISAIVTIINDTMVNIAGLGGIQMDSTKGATKSEHDLWIIAANLAEHVCYGLKSYYEDQNDMTQYEFINYTISDFLYGQKTEVKTRMEKVHDTAAGIPILALADFNIVAQDITDLNDGIKDFSDSQPVRGVIKANTKAATTQLPPLFTILRKNYKKLDNLIGTFKKTQVNFFEAYTNARNIINLGKVQVAEELDLMPKEYQAIFGKKLKVGYWITVRNHSQFPGVIYLTDNPENLAVQNEVTVKGEQDMKLEIPKDFKGIFGHWVMVFNPNELDNIQITVILSKTKSQSDADEKPNIA